MEFNRYIELVQKLYDWENEIPAEILARPQGEEYKVRGTWFSSGLTLLAVGEKKKYLDEQTIQEYHNLKRHITETNLKHRLKTDEDIEMLDSILEKILTQKAQPSEI